MKAIRKRITRKSFISKGMRALLVGSAKGGGGVSRCGPKPRCKINFSENRIFCKFNSENKTKLFTGALILYFSE